MKNKCIYFIILNIFIGVILSGCVEKYPNDIMYSDLRLTNVRLNKIFINQSLENDETELIYKYLKLTIKSKNDIWDYAKKNNYLVRVGSRFCERPEENVLIALNSLYWNDINITNNILLSDSPIKADSNGDIEYTVYINVDSKSLLGYTENINEKNEYKFKPFDLSIDPEDICIEINSRTMFSSVVSNVVVVNKKEIAKEFSKQ